MRTGQSITPLFVAGDSGLEPATSYLSSNVPTVADCCTKMVSPTLGPIGKALLETGDAAAIRTCGVSKARARLPSSVNFVDLRQPG